MALAHFISTLVLLHVERRIIVGSRRPIFVVGGGGFLRAMRVDEILVISKVKGIR